MSALIVPDGSCITVKDERLVIKPPAGEIIVLERLPLAYNTIVFDASSGGYVSFAAMGWLAECEISWCVVYRSEGTICTSQDSIGKQELHRAQARHEGTANITRTLLGAKCEGQARVAEQVLGDPETAARIRRYASALVTAETNPQLTGAEGHCAKAYWAAWVSAGVSVPFTAADAKRVPARWGAFQQRASLYQHDTSSKNRHATDPVNSMLNFGYSCGETLATMACQAVGLSPLFGLSHNKRERHNQEGGKVRRSMALDLLEVIRPEIDAIVLRILARPASLRFRDFLQLKTGVTRITSAALKREIMSAVRELEPVLLHWATQARDMFLTGEMIAATPETTELTSKCAALAALALAA